MCERQHYDVTFPISLEPIAIYTFYTSPPSLPPPPSLTPKRAWGEGGGGVRQRAPSQFALRHRCSAYAHALVGVVAPCQRRRHRVPTLCRPLRPPTSRRTLTLPRVLGPTHYQVREGFGSVRRRIVHFVSLSLSLSLSLYLTTTGRLLT